MSGQTERKLPFSLEAEQSVLGSILIDPQALDVVAGIISVDDFYLEEHKSIYSCMQGMYIRSKNIDGSPSLRSLFIRAYTTRRAAGSI